MFKVTCFSSVSPEELWVRLKGLRFSYTTEGFVWQQDQSVFKIIPFKNPPRGSTYGYRVYFSGPQGTIHGPIYLFDMALGWSDITIKGIEYFIYDAEMNHQSWLDLLLRTRSFKTINAKGIFSKGRVGIIPVDDGVNLQIRPSKGKNLKLIECLHELERVRDEVKPQKYDLFSFSEEEAI